MPINKDLQKERNAATFNPNDISVVLYGGKENLKLKRIAQKQARDDPDFQLAEDMVTKSREDAYDHAVALSCNLKVKSRSLGYDTSYNQKSLDNNSPMFYLESAFIDTVHPFGLHGSMFLSTIHGQATEEQKARWLPKCNTMEIIGTYAQTEIGHGTFLRGLETTAVYDREREEFILHSPTISSIKYWPGGLGKTCNHAIVMAQLYIGNKSYGMHAFMVQLRRFDDHTPLPGIEVGDINKKFGYHNMDNGYLKFDHHRIPRTNMLMRYSQVSSEGHYTRQAIPQITYFTMVLLRGLIVLGSASELGMAATIATRYSAVRRQTANSKGIEPQILDYQTQQLVLFPSIASAYAFYFTGLSVRKTFMEISAAVNENSDVSRLAELHNLTCCLKAFTTEVSSDLVELCRRACGGHGYSHASGIPKIYVRCVPGCTYEGENTVMYLQSARSLMKFFGKAQSGEAMPETLQFLKDALVIPGELKKAEKFSLKLLLQACKLNTLAHVTHVAGQIQSDIYSGTDAEIAWNNHSVDLVAAAKMQALYFTSQMFASSLFSSPWEPRAQAVMSQLCELFIVHNILNNSGSFLQNGVLTISQITSLSTCRLQLLAKLRPNAVALVDAFDYPDRILNSCLGRYDGNVYEALYEYAKKSELNKQEVHPSFYKYIKPMQEILKRSKL